MHTWKDEITTALRKNGESWEDIEYTPFTDEQLVLSPDDSDGDLHFYEHDVAAYSEEWVYYVEFDLDRGYASVHSVPRHPEVLAEVVRREEAIRQIAQSLTGMK